MDVLITTIEKEGNRASPANAVRYRFELQALSQLFFLCRVGQQPLFIAMADWYFAESSTGFGIPKLAHGNDCATDAEKQAPELVFLVFLDVSTGSARLHAAPPRHLYF